MADLLTAKLAYVAKTVVHTCLGVREGEQLLIVSDDESDPVLVSALHAAAVLSGADVTVITQAVRGLPGAPANAVVSAAIAGADCVISPTTYALSFTPAFGEAITSKRCRGIVMTGMRSEHFTAGAAFADYDEVYEITKSLVEIFDAGSTMHVTSAAGSDLTASIEGIRGHIGASFAREPGQVSSFPSGEAWLAPVVGSGNGVLVADGSAHMVGKLTEPITVEFVDGLATSIRSSDQAAVIDEATASATDGRNLGELSVGTNRSARFTGNITEDKKRMGTMHFALGSSVLGGPVLGGIHLDMLIVHPTLEVDGRVVVDEGKIVV